MAVLVFAHSAKQEFYVKNWGNTSLFEHLNKRTLNCVKQLGLPYFVVTEKEQIGASFGERFSNALQFVFDAGYDSVIAIGNDTPFLKKRHILDAQRHVLSNKTVLGPSQDGGFYLLGIQKQHFDKSAFQKSISWKTSKVFSETSTYFDNLGCNLETLTTLRDIDLITDVRSAINFIKSLPQNILCLLRQLLSTCTTTITLFEDVKHTSVFAKTYLNKGSPLANQFSV